MSGLTMLLHNSPVNGHDFRLRLRRQRSFTGFTEAGRAIVGKETISLWNQPEAADQVARAANTAETPVWHLATSSSYIYPIPYLSYGEISHFP